MGRVYLNTEQLAAAAFLPIMVMDEMITSGRIKPDAVSRGENLFEFDQARQLIRLQTETENSLLWVAAHLQLPPTTILAWMALGLISPIRTREGYFGFGIRTRQMIERLRSSQLCQDGLAGRKEALLSIGDVAKILGVSTHTLRAWEWRHNVIEPRRTPSGQRRYTLDEVELLRKFKNSSLSHDAAAMGLGLTLPEKEKVAI